MQVTIKDKRWLDWTDEFLDRATREPMSQSMSEQFVAISMTEFKDDRQQTHAEFEQKLKELNSMPVLIFEAHAKRIGLSVNPYLKAFVAMALSKGNPGVLVMYAHALRRLQQRKELTKPMTINDVVNGPFAFGFVKEDELHRMWDKQKLSREDREALGITGFGDNYLDLVVDDGAVPRQG